MHRAWVDSLTPGNVLGTTIHSERGDVLLARGAVLTDRYIRALAERGYRAVFVMDGIADDIEPRSLITDELRASAVATVRGLFGRVSQDTAARGDHLTRDVSRLSPIGEAILDEVMDEDALAGMAPLKAFDTYAFEHAVEVAVYGVMLGKRIGLSRPLLRDVALGCLLHDIGMQYIDPRTVNKRGRLDRAEIQQVMQHPRRGFELVRTLQLPNPRPAHIVLQHHEHQDGAGYPNGLVGTNQIHRTDAERFNPKRISLMAEITAIADVYSALSSDRPYRPAAPPDRIFDLLRADNGRHLNRELVAAFVTYVQHFPIGSHVEFTGGEYDGARGVVYDVSANAPTRPRVRVLFDRRGNPLAEGVEVDTREQPPDVTLRVLPDSGRPLSALAGAAHPVR